MYMYTHEYSQIHLVSTAWLWRSNVRLRSHNTCIWAYAQKYMYTHTHVVTQTH